jgi:hypothetical protein
MHNLFYDLPIDIQNHIITLKYKLEFNQCIHDTVTIAKFIKNNKINYKQLDFIFNNLSLMKGFLLYSLPSHKNYNQISIRSYNSCFPTKQDIQQFLRNNKIKYISKLTKIELKQKLLSF